MRFATDKSVHVQRKKKSLLLNHKTLFFTPNIQQIISIFDVNPLTKKRTDKNIVGTGWENPPRDELSFEKKNIVEK